MVGKRKAESGERRGWEVPCAGDAHSQGAACSRLRRPRADRTIMDGKVVGRALSVLGISLTASAQAAIITNSLTFPPRPIGASLHAPVWSVSDTFFAVQFPDWPPDVTVRSLTIVDPTPSVALPAVGETVWGGRQLVHASGLMRVGAVDGPTQLIGWFHVAIRGLDEHNGVRRFEVECRSFLLTALGRFADIRRIDGPFPIGILTTEEVSGGLYTAAMSISIPVEWSQGDGAYWFPATEPAMITLVPSRGSLLVVGSLAIIGRRRRGSSLIRQVYRRPSCDSPLKAPGRTRGRGRRLLRP